MGTERIKQFILDLGDGVPTPSPGENISSNKEEKTLDRF